MTSFSPVEIVICLAPLVIAVIVALIVTGALRRRPDRTKSPAPGKKDPDASGGR